MTNLGCVGIVVNVCKTFCLVLGNAPFDGAFDVGIVERCTQFLELWGDERRNWIGARVFREDSPMLYDAIGWEEGSLLRLVNTVSGWSDGEDRLYYLSMVLAPDVPVEVRRRT